MKAHADSNDAADNDAYAVLTTGSRAEEKTRVLKQGDTFAIFDRAGDIVQSAARDQGIYHDGTRFLSYLRLRINGERPVLLSSSVRKDNVLMVTDLTNPDILFGDPQQHQPASSLHIFRSTFLWDATCYHQVAIANYGLTPTTVTISFSFAADYADIFEVRGTPRNRRGELHSAHIDQDSLILGYTGLDNVKRITTISFDAAIAWRESSATLIVPLAPQSRASFQCVVQCNLGYERRALISADRALASSAHSFKERVADHCQIESSNAEFDHWIQRSFADLYMMITPTPAGLYPYAGIPWFSTPFGRDGLITALELLWVDPTLAHGVLSYLSANQARDTVPERDAQPGKILHETRGGEMAALGEIPFGRYYGSVDATPLFIVLASAYYEHTSDSEFIRTIWPAVKRALDWMDSYGDTDHDGFVEYLRHTEDGLVNQGWKDSQDSISHADGRLAVGPIALCEVQAYVYAARCGAATLASALGEGDLSQRLREQAQALRIQFESCFWDDKLATYVLALDGQKNPCRVRASNAGHALFCGIADAQRAARVAETLLGKKMNSGWGIRTLAADEVRYNPMSYHNGSVWPHDNALASAGFGRYGLTAAASEIMSNLFEASIYMDLSRLPELFCGFHKRPAEAPTLYPVACAPQAWAAGAVFMLLQACLGLSVNAQQKRITLLNARLPPFLSWLRLSSLKVGNATIDLDLRQNHGTLEVIPTANPSNIEVVNTQLPNRYSQSA